MSSVFVKKTSGITECPATLCEKGLFYLAVIDEFGQVTFANTYFSGHFYPADPLPCSRNIFDLIHPDDREAFGKILRGCSEEASDFVSEIRLASPGHQTIRWEISSLKKEKCKKDKYLCVGYEMPGYSLSSA
jgi:hypothetical protein